MEAVPPVPPPVVQSTATVNAFADTHDPDVPATVVVMLLPIVNLLTAVTVIVLRPSTLGVLLVPDSTTVSLFDNPWFAKQVTSGVAAAVIPVMVPEGTVTARDPLMLTVPV
jgi:hypothetical protein